MSNRQLALVVVSCARVVAGITVACALMVLDDGRDAEKMVEVKGALDRLEGWARELGGDGSDGA